MKPEAPDRLPPIFREFFGPGAPLAEFEDDAFIEWIAARYRPTPLDVLLGVAVPFARFLFPFLFAAIALVLFRLLVLGGAGCLIFTIAVLVGIGMRKGWLRHRSPLAWLATPIPFGAHRRMLSATLLGVGAVRPLDWQLVPLGRNRGPALFLAETLARTAPTLRITSAFIFLGCIGSGAWILFSIAQPVELFGLTRPVAALGIAAMILNLPPILKGMETRRATWMFEVLAVDAYRKWAPELLDEFHRARSLHEGGRSPAHLSVVLSMSIVLPVVANLGIEATDGQPVALLQAAFPILAFGGICTMFTPSFHRWLREDANTWRLQTVEANAAQVRALGNHWHRLIPSE